MTPIKTPKKLIEVALPLDDINAAAAREKSIRHGHPSTLHLWWARRPLAAARAVLFAQLVNDPGYQRELGFGVNKREAEIKRNQLFDIIRELVKWENTNNEAVLKRAREAIWESWRETCHLNRNHPQAAELFDPEKLPAFHDPFAGGGAIPLEAQRLGLESYASDLNPVAVMINKAMIEIPPKFAGQAPVGPIPESDKGDKKRGTKDVFEEWSGARGLAEDVRRYGHWMREEAFKRIGHLYPKITITEEMLGNLGERASGPHRGRDALAPREDLRPYLGQELTVIAWLWARTVKSPNPAFSHVEVPLASSFVLSSKKGKEAWVEPIVEGDSYRFEVRIAGSEGVPPSVLEKAKQGTKRGRGANFNCLFSDTPIQPKYIYAEAQAGRINQRLMAIVAEGVRGRVYLPPTKEMEEVADQAEPEWRPESLMPENRRWFSPPMYGMKSYGDLFTPRQLVALTTFSDLVQEARERVIADYLGARASRPQEIWHRTHLPHFEAGEHPQHIVFRLADSLPQSLLNEWGEELKRLSEKKKDVERRKRIEQALDQGYGQCWLKRPEIAELVQNALLHFNDERYRIHAWVVMPNHVHVLVTPLHGNSLSSILHSWKSFTSKEANKLLQRKGAFWHADYFDRYIRNEEHYYRAAEYIAENPVRAGLCKSPKEWPFSSAGELTAGSEGVPPSLRAGGPHSQDSVPLAEGGTGATAGSEGVSPSTRAGGPRSQDSVPLAEGGTGATAGSEGVSPSTRAGGPRSQDSVPLAEGGCGATAYGDAVAVYLALAISKVIDRGSTITRWDPTPTQSGVINTFSRQAIPMTWDFSESSPLGFASGSLVGSLDLVVKNIVRLGMNKEHSSAHQSDAQTQAISLNKVVSTDPPYYDNIGYADLSDFFYVWLRRSLRPIYPNLFATMAVPKAEELVATPYRHGGKEQAEAFFMDGMTRAIHNLAEQAHPAFPVTIYYAFKQAETKSAGTASTGWETFLEAVIRAGFSIDGTWPMRTEMGNRMIGSGTNALASSIVLVCKRRAWERGPLALDEGGTPSFPGPTLSRRDFQRQLREQMPEALETMIGGETGQAPIAPVDLAQAAIGPGMAIFSQYAAVLNQDGSPMGVHDALILINRSITDYLSPESGSFDADTQFCSSWFDQYGWSTGPFGEADTLSRAKGTSVDGVREAGVVESGSGKVRLLKWREYQSDWDPTTDNRIPIWQACHQMIRRLNNQGESAAGELLAKMPEKGEPIRQLVYHLYTLCERKSWAEDARAYNELIGSWPAIVAASHEVGHSGSQAELGLDF